MHFERSAADNRATPKVGIEQEDRMKKLVAVGAVVLFVGALVLPVIAQGQQAPAAKVEPKGTEGPDVRKVEPKGTEGPDVRKAKKKTAASVAPRAPRARM